MPAKPRAREKDSVQLATRQLLEYHGWQTHRLEADIKGPKHRADREQVGTPDLIAVKRRDRFYPSVSTCVYLECKSPGQKLRPGQELEHARLRCCGFPVYVIENPAVDLYKLGLIEGQER